MKTFAARVIEASAKHPKRTAILASCQSQVTYRDLLETASSIQKSFPMRKGERVMIGVSDKALYMAAFLATNASGASVVPTDVADTDAVCFTAEDCGVERILTDGKESDIREIQSRLDGIAIHSLSQLALTGEPLVDCSDLNDSCVLLYTSGTTGKRKGVELSNRAFISPSYSMNDAMELSLNDREYVCGDLNHAFGLGRMRCILPIGATAVVHNAEFQPIRALAAIVQEQCNGLAGPAGTVLLMFNELREKFTALTSQLRYIKMASQPISVADKEALIETMTQTRLFQNYGLSEAQRVTLLEMKLSPDKLKSSGLPLEGHEVRIWDAASQSFLQHGETGHIAVKAPVVMTGYWRRPDLNDKVFEQGFLITQDLGYMDHDGFLYVVGRADEVINTGGEKYEPEQIEHAIRPFLPDVSFCVFAVDDPSGTLGQVPCLAIEQPEHDGEVSNHEQWPQIRFQITRSKPGVPIPKTAFVMTELPRTANGKLQRARLTKSLGAA